jgi:hypothetical protein
VRIVLACLAALVAYPIASWLTRLLVTVATLPLAGWARDAGSAALMRAIRLIGGAACGAGGFAAASWAAASLGMRAWPWLAAALVALVAVAHASGIRRLRGGPQVAEEMFGWTGEELGLVVAATWHLVA